ncbi:c-type cytochrome [Microvirga pudoricolor]|uniref:c-type cytochrome n=1 Tax=Microvirga pudoricolor TaxID=2778729 RepID=UPI00194E1B29|nr:cytochrome c [Microvirga pudoricolor]MBM6594943.1 cytochrome c [Microvirga pudoricolor]
MRIVIAVPLIAALALASCDSGTDDLPTTSSTRAVMRGDAPVPAGSVPRGAGAAVLALAAPGPAVTDDLLRRGGERYAVFCTPCHGADGSGNGSVTARGFPRPASFQDARLASADPEQIVSVITHGLGAMYPLAESIPPQDRWAIAHYVKSLQAGSGSARP